LMPQDANNDDSIERNCLFRASGGRTRRQYGEKWPFSGSSTKKIATMSSETVFFSLAEGIAHRPSGAQKLPKSTNFSKGFSQRLQG
jgi:hypothetical protein